MYPSSRPDHPPLADLGQQAVAGSQWAAFLHYRNKAWFDPDALAQELATRHACDLLAEAIPRTHHRLYGLVGGLGSGAKSLAFYEELNRELGQPAGGTLLEAPSISLHTIRIARQVSADPVLQTARKAIGEDALYLRHLTSVLGMLRSLDLANHIERLPDYSGIQKRALEILSRIHSKRQAQSKRMKSRFTFPLDSVRCSWPVSESLPLQPATPRR